jgi:type IV secretory pathway VirB3-like protein
MVEQRIAYLAFVSVARACGFGALAIITTGIGLAAIPALALKATGIMTLFMAAVLWLKAQYTTTKEYRTTEVWCMLPKHERPTPDVARTLIMEPLRDQFLLFAARSATVSAFMLFGALVLASLGRSV